MKTPGIIVTIGPASEKLLPDLQQAGADVFRLNFSHGSYEWHAEKIKMLRALKKPPLIMLDTKGPEIRTGEIQNPIELKKGDRLTLINKERAQNEENRLIFCSYLDLPKAVTPGYVIQFDNGNFCGKVTSTHQSSVVVELLSDGILKSKKHVNLPGIRVNLPTITPKDAEDLKFGVQQGIDMVALSFTRDARDIREVREIVGPDVKIIAKIESHEGVDKFRSIARVADGIMIARGDLGVEMPIEQIPVIQRKILRDLNTDFPEAISIVATGMLLSMTNQKTPHRAEVSDVATAVWQGASYLMLSDETASGTYPVESVEMMKKIIDFAALNAPKE